MDDNLIQKFGYSELYEWAKVPENVSRLGKFVQFDERNPGKVRLAKNAKNIVGISTINSAADSDNPSEWHLKNMFNEYGDIYLQKEKLAVGQKVYDQLNEMAYIQTRPWEHLIPIENPKFDSTQQYRERTSREEWVRVNLMGKVVVEDDGTLQPGDYCTPYEGKLTQKQGTAIKATAKSKLKYYVLERLSDKTILILNK